jgi:endonuclease-8
MLGPDLLDANYDQAEAVRRLHDPSRAQTAVGEAILDQRAVAGIGNVFKSEVLFMEQVDPFALVGTLDEETIGRILSTAREHLKANARPEAAAGRTTTVDLKTGKHLAPSRLWVYDRAGRPCHRCGTIIAAEAQGIELPRTTYFCPSCQAPAGKPAGKAAARAAAKAASRKA